MELSNKGQNFCIRPATLAEIKILARHRCEMFRDMGKLQDEYYDMLAEESEKYFEQAMPRGEYVAWIVSPSDQLRLIVAGAGMQLRTILPRPHEDGTILKPGPQGYILNVYTEKEWRRNGLGEALVCRILQWCRENGVSSVALHASDMGRPLYEKLGFVQTNEMRFTGEL